MKSRVLAILLVVALLVTVAVFSVQAESTVKTPAEAQAIIDAAAAESFTSLFDGATDTVDATCPCCGDTVTWHPLASGASGQLDATDAENFKAHYYLAESFSVESAYLKTVAYDSDADSGVEYCLYLNGNTITAESLRGIWVQYGSTLNLLGETGGITAAGTGAVATNSAHRGAIDTNGEVNVYGGTYQNVEGTARSVVTMRAYDFAFNMYGGTIQSNNDAYAVYMYNTSNKGGFNAVGGTIDGGVCIDIEGADVSVDGTAVINSDNGGLDLTKGALLTLGDNLASGADITVTVNDGAFTNESANAATIAAAGYIKDTVAAKAIRAVDNKLVLGTVKDAADAMSFTESTSAVCPYCGTVETWEPLTAGITAATTVASGHYYLDPNATYSNSSYYTVNTDVCLHLNGQNITSSGRVFWVNLASGGSAFEMTVMGSGKVTGAGTASSTATTNRGAAFDVSHNNSQNKTAAPVLNLFGGTYATSNTSPILTMRTYFTGSSYYNWPTTVNMYGGELAGSETQKYASVMTLCGTATFNLHGGTITGAGANTGYGGSIHAYAGQVKTGKGATVINMTGGTITGGNAATGGNIALRASSTFNMSGGLLTLGEATGNGGNIFAGGADGYRVAINISGTAQITGGQSAGGVGGGGVYLGSYVDATMSGGTVSGNKSTNASASAGGGNFVVSANSTLTVSGTAQIKNGESATYGGNISARAAGAEITINGGSISGGTASGNGGSIYVTGGTIDITGGKIGVDKDGNAAGGTTEANGGNLYLAGAAVATISGDAEIANGSANRGGNIGGGNSAQLTINADAEDATVVPTISGGTATEYGGNIFATGAFTMNAGNVQGGYAAEEGGSMYFMNWDNTADVNIAINGGVIDGKPYEDAGVNNGSHGGLIYAYTNPDQASGTGLTLTLKDVTLTNGKIDTAYNGSAVYMSGSTLILDGDTQIDDSNNDIPVYVTGTSSLTVNAGFTGEVRVYASLADGTTYGDQLVSSGTGVFSCTGEYTGTVRLLNVTGACAIGDYDTATSTGTLWVAGVVLCKDDTIVDGALNAADAVAKFASGNYDYIRSYTDETTFELTDNTVTYVIDLDGRDITVNAAEGVTGVVFAGLDTNATTSAATGAVATLGEGVVNGVQYKDNDKDGTIYIGLESEGTVAYHALTMDITGVSLRTTTGGIYYWASVKCDDTLAAELDSFGIIFGLNEAAPAAIGEDLTMFSEITEDILTDGTEMTGAIMNNVLEAGRTDPTNDAAGVMKIWGVPYVTITYTDADGYEQTAEILADEAQSAHMSIYDVVSKLDAYIGTLEDTDATKTTYLNLMTEKFDWEGYAFTDEDWLAVKASLDAKKAALNTETAE